MQLIYSIQGIDIEFWEIPMKSDNAGLGNGFASFNVVNGEALGTLALISIPTEKDRKQVFKYPILIQETCK